MTAAIKSSRSDVCRGVYLFSTAPPRITQPEAALNETAERLLKRLSKQDYDGLIVYDIQDESSRNPAPRPFPFIPAQDANAYSQVLKGQSAAPVITYKNITGQSPESFACWLEKAWHRFTIDNLVLVGNPSSKTHTPLSLSQAYDILKQKGHPFTLGGVTIAERHAGKNNEHHRLVYKGEMGCHYFISQTVYNADLTIRLLQQYAEACSEKALKPKRIILTFAPCGSEKTLTFMKWLGIDVPKQTASRLCQAADPLNESIKICQTNLARILAACDSLNIPLGLNIEHLTQRQPEVEAAIELFASLKARLEQALEHRAASTI